jgi:hypothetical protein
LIRHYGHFQLSASPFHFHFHCQYCCADAMILAIIFFRADAADSWLPPAFAALHAAIFIDIFDTPFLHYFRYFFRFSFRRPPRQLSLAADIFIGYASADIQLARLPLLPLRHIATFHD